MNNKKALIFIAIMVVAFISARLLNVNSSILNNGFQEALRVAVKENYAFSVALYIAFTSLACVFLALPGVTFALIAGIMFGSWAGSVFCLTGTTLGAVLSFLAGRYFLKDTVKPIVMKNTALSNLLFTGKADNEIFLLMITRLLPVFPFNLQNFAYGVTDISIVKYSLATFIFMIPGVTCFTFAAAGLIDESSRGKLLITASIIAAVTMLLSIFVRRLYDGYLKYRE